MHLQGTCRRGEGRAETVAKEAGRAHFDTARADYILCNPETTSGVPAIYILASCPDLPEETNTAAVWFTVQVRY